MKRTTNVAKVVVIPLVALGLVVWFSVSDPPAHAGPTSACAHVEPCAENVCCGDPNVSQAGGCPTRECCDVGTQCAGHERVNQPFPKPRIDGSGCCLVAGSLQDWCEYHKCRGATLCAEGTCYGSTEPEDVEVIQHHEVVCGKPCPVSQQ